MLYSLVKSVPLPLRVLLGSVEDDGVGIAAPDYNKVKSMGLKNLQNRVDFLKGKMDIQSQDQQGTTINIELNTDA